MYLLDRLFRRVRSLFACLWQLPGVFGVGSQSLVIKCSLCPSGFVCHDRINQCMWDVVVVFFTYHLFGEGVSLIVFSCPLSLPLRLFHTFAVMCILPTFSSGSRYPYNRRGGATWILGKFGNGCSPELVVAKVACLNGDVLVLLVYY